MTDTIKKNIKKYKLHCKTLSRVHIGSGETLSRWEYVFYEGKIYKTTDRFWTYYLKTQGKVRYDQLINSINNSSDKFSLTMIIKDSFRSYQSYLEPLSLDLDDEVQSVRNISLFTSQNNRYYIPGSSIKGSLRTAIVVKDLVNRFPDNGHELEKAVKNLSRYEQGEINKSTSIISQTFQRLIVEDSYLKFEDMGIGQIKYLSKENEDENFDLKEVFLGESSFMINLTEKEYLYKDEGLSSFMRILEEASEFYKRSWNELYQRSSGSVLDDFYSSNNDLVRGSGYLLRVGYGSGQLSNSILLDWQEEGLDDSYLYNGQAAKLKRQGIENYPSSCRSSNGMPMGWILVEKIEAL